MHPGFEKLLTYGFIFPVLTIFFWIGYVIVHFCFRFKRLYRLLLWSNRQFHDFCWLNFLSNFILRRLAEDFLTDYMHINIGSQEMHANHNILQIVDVCEEYQKEQKLARLLEEIGCESKNKILIFVETKRKCDDLTRLMRRDGFPAMVSSIYLCALY